MATTLRTNWPGNIAQRYISNGAAMPKETHKSHTLGNGTTGRKTKVKQLPLYLSQPSSADTTAVCCWIASAKPAVSLTNLFLQSLMAEGSGAAETATALQGKAQWTEVGMGSRQTFQVAALGTSYLGSPLQQRSKGRKQSLWHLK